MIYTEAEAAKKLCPFMSKFFNKRCVGSACMLWLDATGDDRIMVTLPGEEEKEWAWNPHTDPRGNREFYVDAKVRLEPQPKAGYCGRRE